MRSSTGLLRSGGRATWTEDGPGTRGADASLDDALSEAEAAEEYESKGVSGGAGTETEDADGEEVTEVNVNAEAEDEDEAGSREDGDEGGRGGEEWEGGRPARLSAATAEYGMHAYVDSGGLQHHQDISKDKQQLSTSSPSTHIWSGKADGERK